MVFENTSHAICVWKLKRCVNVGLSIHLCPSIPVVVALLLQMMERVSQLLQHHFAPTVDNSGRWGRGGVFSALSARSPRPEQQYEMAHEMNDLHLGDVHLIAVDDLESRDTGRDFVRYL